MQANGLKRMISRSVVGCCLCVAALSSVPGLAQGPIEDEALLKTAFVYNFAKFTRWPTDAWEGPDNDLMLCTIGDGLMVRSLARLGSEKVRGRSVTVRALMTESRIDACHMLFISGSVHRHMARIIARVGKAPILTISEIRGFSDAGGIIQLYRAQKRVRFKINLRAATEKRLEISSRLLDLAEVVGGEAAP
jgi:hypothetical protein